MKTSRNVPVCFVLFALCLSESLAYTFLNNLLCFIVYSVLVLVISFGVLYKSTNKCFLLEHGHCFKLLFDVVVAFVLVIIFVSVSSALLVSSLVYFCGEPVAPAFRCAIQFIQIVCMPFLVVVLESAIVMLVKNAKVCPKMK